MNAEGVASDSENEVAIMNYELKTVLNPIKSCIFVLPKQKGIVKMVKTTNTLIKIKSTHLINLSVHT